MQNRLLTKLAYVFRLLVGGVLLLSGLLKAMHTAAFADLMSQYGAGWFGYAAPVIIAVELFLGILLFLNARPRLFAALTVAFIAIVSAIFLYGVLARGITDCGCFGPLTWLNSRPWITFVRNALIIALLLPSLLSEQQGTPLTRSSFACMTAVAAMVMFLCGYTMHGAQCLKAAPKPFRPIPLAEHPLSEFVTCHSDSTYMVFAFSYTCPHCLNSIGNVSQFVPMGVVDRVIGLSVQDSVGSERFRRLFDVNFDILEISDEQMRRITPSLPVSIFISHDTIENMIGGQVVSPALALP